MHSDSSEDGRELLFREAITRKPDVLTFRGAFGHGKFMKILRQPSCRGLEREILREIHKVRHMLASSGDQLKAHGRMLPREPIHRVHVEQAEPCLGRRPGADDMPPGAERGCDAERVSWAIEYFEDLLS